MQWNLLPTPTTEPNTGNGHARDLGGEVGALLPTPAASLTNDGEDAEQWRARFEHHAGKCEGATRAGLPLPIAVQETEQRAGWTDWGRYAHAIRAAEDATGRPAPAPTTPDGRGGRPRLSVVFVEWMMMLPEGHVTAVPGLSRRETLRLLGNGVVPPAAALATAVLIDRVAATVNGRERGAQQR